MANNETYNYRKHSLDNLHDQANVLYNVRNFHNGEGSQDFVAEPVFASPQSNMYYAEQYPASEARSAMPFMYNPREDPMNSLGRMDAGNYMGYGANNESSMKVPNHVNFIDQTNGNLSGVDYPIDYSNYNLFSNAPASSPFDSSASENATPHLIQNLVGHWGSGGTYTPFGSSIKNIGDFGNDGSVRKPRMVAEVRPMRPSYSDVLAKSAPNQKPGKPAEGKIKTAEVKNNNKGGKSSVGRTLSGSSGLGNRQNSDENKEQSSKQLKLLNTLKKWIHSNNNNRQREEPMKKKWVSLDDLNGSMNDSDFISEESSKKVTTKVSSSKKVKESWEPAQVSNGRATAGKNSDVNKKPVGNVAPKVQAVNREKENNVTPKVEVNRNKPTDDRKGTNQKSTDSSKGSRRNSRGVQADKGKAKIGKTRRRDGGGWRGVLANRLDVALACVMRAATWLVTLVFDVFALSTKLSFYMCTMLWHSSVSSVSSSYISVSDWLRKLSFIQRISASRIWPFRRTERIPPPSDEEEEDSDSEGGDGKKKRKRLPGGLKHNLPLPSTGDEAMKRLLSCKGKDPYSILGVSQDCTDDDIKKYYKRQAFLVHPDKNNQPGAEEAFKILVHAFDIIGEPEHRKSYDRNVEKTAQAEQAWSELSDLLAQLHKKMEYVANTLRCTNCGKRHKRTLINRPIYAARMCSQCNIHHSVREGDIWAETSMLGLMWRYLACMDGSVYDISEWAACQGGNLKNLKANTHQVQYRIVLGKHAQKGRSQQTSTANGEPDLEEFINNLYTKPESGSGGDATSEARNRKHKRKK